MSKEISIPCRTTFQGGNPNDFMPDSSACTEAQKENFAAHLNLYNAQIAAGETPSPLPADTSSPASSMFGVGFQGTFKIGGDDE
jgi:hypothetical protein